MIDKIKSVLLWLLYSSGYFVVAAIIILGIYCHVTGYRFNQEDTTQYIQYESTTDSSQEYTSKGTPIIDYNDSDFDIISVDSTCFSEVGYDSNTKELYVKFLESGDEYVYYDVSKRTYENLINADSIGSYYYHHIRSEYECSKFK